MIDSKMEKYLDDIRAKHKSFALQKDLSHVIVQLELKADLNDVNESFSNKANKTTVANALHRKANKGETEEALKEKLDRKDLKDILESFKKDFESQCNNNFSKQRENFVKIDHFKELEDIILRKADKSEIDMYLSAVNTQKNDFDRRVRLIEKDTADILKTVQAEIESMRTSCIETLSRKTDNYEFDKLNEEVHRKLNSEAVMSLINKAKSDLYININEVKEELTLGHKKYQESVYDRASRAELNSEHTLEEINNLRKEIEDLRHATNNIEKDTIEYSKNMYEASRKEMKYELGKVSDGLTTFKTDITHRVDNSLLTEEFDKHRDQTEIILKDKVDVDEVQRAITGCQNDTINRITAVKQEILKLIGELNASIAPALDQKVDHEELTNRLSDLITKDELTNELEVVNSHLISDVRNLYSQVERKTDQTEFREEKNKVSQILESLESEVSSKFNEEEARNLIDMKCNIDDVNKALTEVHDELDIKANSQEFENHSKMQTEINQAL